MQAMHRGVRFEDLKTMKKDKTECPKPVRSEKWRKKPDKEIETKKLDGAV